MHIGQWNTALRIGVVVATMAGGLALSASGAQAAPAPGKHSAVQLSGWIGECFATLGSTFAGGWCDGNGPDWTYIGFVECTNAGFGSGVERWAGDRRGSYVGCPPGGSATEGGVSVYHNRVFQFNKWGYR